MDCRKYYHSLVMIFIYIWWLLKEPFCVLRSNNTLLAARVLGDRLCSLTHSVLSQLTGQQQPNGRLYLTRTNCALLVVVGEAGCFAGNPLENIMNERVHDSHSFAGNSCVGVDLFEHFVDVNGVAFSSLFGSLLPIT